MAGETPPPASTLRTWEHGRRVPDGPPRVLLALIANHPTVVQETLSAA